MWKSILLAGTAFLLATACTHNPHKAEKMKTKMDAAQPIQDEKVGVKDGNMVVQKKVEMAEELRRIQFDVYELEDRVYGNRKYGSNGLYGTLKECRTKLTSKENGGDGKLMWTEPVDRVTEKEEEFNLGVDEENRVVGVSEEFLRDRLARFRKYKSLLSKRQDEYEEKLEICDAAMSTKAQGAKKEKASQETEESP
jgi:hypothetical protein